MMKGRKSYFFVWITVLLMLFNQLPVAYAQTDQKEDYLPLVKDVKVKGNVVVSDTVILNKVKARKGHALSRELINQDIKRLYSAGFFKDVKVDLVPDGDDFAVVFIVDEKPVISSIKITGNSVFNTSQLMKEVSLRAGQVLDNKLLKEGIRNIEEKYKKKGYRFIFIEDEVSIDEDSKKATITININEGKKFKIRSIEFTGNTYSPGKKLRKVMSTKKANKWLFRSGSFDEFTFEDDLDRLSYYYQKEGFLDVEVTPTVNYDNAENNIYLELQIKEGIQYVAGEVTFEGNTVVPDMELWRKLAMLPGTVYSTDRLRDDVNNVKKSYFEKGHIDAVVEPEVKFDKTNGKVDVLYQVVEGDIFYIDTIRIRGNTKTKDVVIRRELTAFPGQRFDGGKLERSKRNLEYLGYFDDVSYSTEPGSERGKRDLIFNVKEKQTGEFSFGGGVSSLESFLVFAEISQRNFDITKWPNFTGGGQSISAKIRWGAISRDVDVSFVEPYIFGKPYSFGVNFYNWEEDVDELDFSTERMGGRLTLGKNFTEHLGGSLSYVLENVEMNDVSSDAFIDVRRTPSDSNLSRIRSALTYDKRDNRLVPSKGFITSLSTEMVGGFIGGDQDYYSVELKYSQYWTFFKKHILQLKTRIGFINEFGGSDFVPVYDRFFAGGLGTVRGYEYRSIGPQGGGNAIGGESLYLASLEYTFPIIENFKGAVFIDAGHVNSTAYEIETGDFAVSVGPGLHINTPIGPVAFYYGYPIANPDDENENGRFEFSFSKGF
ncbi:MAG: outer membrane protein assembly factor BamA [Candidatus Omnitrophica bacterium]|nr:outer membrane protein assembly factor BamA [Candidatus Omnitrophota bacterium]